MAETVIDASTRLKGAIQTEDDLAVYGVVEGPIKSSAVVTVAQGGLVNGPLSAREVTVHGTVEGDVAATGQLLLGPTGRIIGDVRVGHMKVEDGGIIQGKVLMDSPQSGFKTTERK